MSEPFVPITENLCSLYGHIQSELISAVTPFENDNLTLIASGPMLLL